MAAQNNSNDPTSPDYLDPNIDPLTGQPRKSTAPTAGTAPGPVTPFNAPLLPGATRDPSNPNLINFAPGSYAQQQATIAPNGSTPGSIANGGVGTNPATGQPWVANSGANTSTQNPGESNDAYLQRLLTSGGFSSTQAAVDQFNKTVYGGPVTDSSSPGWGQSPAVYQNGTQIGMPNAVWYQQPDGSWNTQQRSGSSGASASGSAGSAGATGSTGVAGTSAGTSATAGTPGSAADPNMAALVTLLQQQQTDATTQKAADQAKSDALYTQLQGQANQTLAIDPNTDPTIKGQVDAFNAQTTRSNRQYLAGLAESAGPIANISSETRLASENAGQAGGQFQATLMGNELTARRAEIQNSLNSMAGMLSAQQTNDLKAQLATIDSAISQQTLAANTAYQQGTLGNNANSIANQLATYYAGLNQNQSQFTTSQDLQSLIAQMQDQRIRSGLSA